MSEPLTDCTLDCVCVCVCVCVCFLLIPKIPHISGDIRLPNLLLPSYAAPPELDEDVTCPPAPIRPGNQVKDMSCVCVCVCFAQVCVCVCVEAACPLHSWAEAERHEWHLCDRGSIFLSDFGKHSCVCAPGLCLL